MNVPKLRFGEFEDEWQKVELGHLTKNISSGKSKPNSDSGFPVYGSMGVIGYSSEFTHSGKTLLIARVGANAGTTNIVEGEISVTDNTLIVSLNHSNTSEFICVLLQRENLNQMAFGSGQPLITAGQLKKLNIYIPEETEQQKIADFLSAVDEKITALTAQKTALTQYKQGMMQRIFAQTLRFKDDNGVEYPEWDIKTLGELAKKSTSKNKDESVKTVFTNSAVQGIVNQLDFFDKDIANQNNLANYYIVEKNDFVYNPRISKFAPVGPIKRNHLGTGVMSPLYTVFRFNEGNLGFMSYLFDTAIWHDYMFSIANFGVRFDRMNISQADFFEMPIAYPCIEEQTKIAQFLTECDDKINAVDAQIQSAQQWKQGLLQQMFV